MRRPTIHRSTLVVALGVLVLVVLLNVPGEIVSPLGGNFGGGYTAEYIHGWPWLSLYRSVFYDFSKPGIPFPVVSPEFGIPSLACPSWKFMEGQTWRLHRAALVGDVVTGLLLIALGAGTWEWRRRRRARLLQISLREAAIVTAIVAAGFGWWRYELAQNEREDQFFDRPEAAHIRTAGSEYHGPLWVTRLIGQSLLWTAFIRTDGIWMEVVNAEQFRKELPILEGFPYLWELELENNVVDDTTQIEFSDLAQFKGLRRLTLTHFNITPDDVSELAHLRQVEEIVLQDWTNIDPDNIQRLVGALPHCRIVEEPTDLDDPRF